MPRLARRAELTLAEDAGQQGKRSRQAVPEVAGVRIRAGLELGSVGRSGTIAPFERLRSASQAERRDTWNQITGPAQVDSVLPADRGFPANQGPFTTRRVARLGFACVVRPGRCR